MGYGSARCGEPLKAAAALRRQRGLAAGGCPRLGKPDRRRSDRQRRWRNRTIAKAAEERPAMGHPAGSVRARLAAAWNFLVGIPGGIYGRVHSDRGKSGAGGPDLSRPGRLFEVQQLGVAVPAVFGHRHRFAVGGTVAKGRDEAV